MNQITQRKIEKYCRDHTSFLNSFLGQIEANTALYNTTPQMLSGKLIGVLLNIILSNKNYTDILEIGSFTGFSTISMATNNTHLKLYSLEVKKERYDHLISQQKIKDAFPKNIEFIKTDALSWLKKDKRKYDVIFIDANKKQYLKYLKIILPKLKLNGLIIADNVLWYNQVLDKRKNNDTNIIDIYNRLMYLEPHLTSVLLPISDGIMLSQFR